MESEEVDTFARVPATCVGADIHERLVQSGPLYHRWAYDGAHREEVLAPFQNVWDRIDPKTGSGGTAGDRRFFDMPGSDGNVGALYVFKLREKR